MINLFPYRIKYNIHITKIHDKAGMSVNSSAYCKSDFERMTMNIPAGMVFGRWGNDLADSIENVLHTSIIEFKEYLKFYGFEYSISTEGVKL